MIDAEHHEGERRPIARRLLDRLGQRGHQVRAIEFASQRIVLRHPEQLLVAGATLVVEPHDAFGAHRPAIRAGEPAAGFLDPEHGRRGAGANAILDTIGHAFATALRGRRVHEHTGADRRRRLDQLCVCRPARKRCRIDIPEDSRRLIGPDDGIACDVPDEGGLTERGENVRHLRPVNGARRVGGRRAGCRRGGGCHGRLVLGRCRMIPCRRIGRPRGQA